MCGCIGGTAQLGADIDGEAADDYSGTVSLSANGQRLAIGARGNDGNGDNAGHVRVYLPDEEVVQQTPPLSLSDQQANTLRVSPVPTRGQIQVHLKEVATGSLVIRLSTLLGNLVWERTTTKAGETWVQSIDLSDLPEGVYLLEVIGESQRWRKKVVKK